MTPTPRLVPDRPSDAALAKAFIVCAASLPDATPGTEDYAIGAFLQFITREAEKIDAAMPMTPDDAVAAYDRHMRKLRGQPPAEAPADKSALVRKAIGQLKTLGEWDGKTFDEDLHATLRQLVAPAEAPAERGASASLNENWRTVRIAPTQEMIDAGRRFASDPHNVWMVMLAASPLAAAPAAPAEGLIGYCRASDLPKLAANKSGAVGLYTAPAPDGDYTVAIYTAPRVTGGRELRDAIDDGLETMELHGMHDECGYKRLRAAFDAFLAANGEATNV